MSTIAKFSLDECHEMIERGVFGPHQGHRIELIRGEMRDKEGAPAQFSMADYDRLIDSGVFDGPNHRRIELIRGELRDMNPIGPFHEDIVDRLARWTYKYVSPERGRLRVQNSIGLFVRKSAPRPDIVLAAPKSYRSARPQPEDVLLLTEVAQGSLRYDRGQKSDLYAEAEIAEYWIVNLADKCIEVHRDPQPDGYRSIQTFGAGESVRPLALPEASLSVDWLFDDPE